MGYTPYIGITGFTKFWQVSEMLLAFVAHSKSGMQRKLHVGVMTSHKTLDGTPSILRHVFPPKDMIAQIFHPRTTRSNGWLYQCLHYADYRHRTDIVAYLATAIACAGDGLDAIQLDMIWPDPAEIAEARSVSGKPIEVILQLGRTALEEVENSPAAVVERLRRYDGVIDRVLLDKSVGRGIGMDAQFLLPFLRAVRESFPKFGLVAAGGLGPGTMHLAKPIVEEFPDISLDAQGRLCPGGTITEPTDWGLARDYLIEALQLCV
jgi:hypothetical protein